MSDLNPTNRLLLGDALRALPLATPARDSWAELATQLAPAVPRRRRYGLPVAIAAACVLAIVAALAVRRIPPLTATAPRVAATVAGAAASSIPGSANNADATNMAPGQNIDALAAAQTRSQSLERWLHDTRRAGSPLPSQDLAAATEIENMIGMVDVELAESAPATALPLWQRRVALLEDLTALRYSNYRLAEIAATTPAAGTLNPIN